MELLSLILGFLFCGLSDIVGFGIMVSASGHGDAAMSSSKLTLTLWHACV